jgi:hypothetical protein
MDIRLRGTAADRLVGRCGFLGRGQFFVPSCGYAEHVLGFVGMFVCVLLLLFERGVFPGYQGTLMAVPERCIVSFPHFLGVG